MITQPQNPNQANLQVKKIDPGGLMENYYDDESPQWRQVEVEYRQQAIADKAYKASLVCRRIVQLQEGHSDNAGYSLLAYLDDELRVAAFYGVDPSTVNPFFVLVLDLLQINISDVSRLREEAAKSLSNGAW